jgi:hypothetical protein
MHNYANLPKLGNRDQNNLLSVDYQLHHHLIYHHRKALDMGSCISVTVGQIMRMRKKGRRKKEAHRVQH